MNAIPDNLPLSRRRRTSLVTAGYYLAVFAPIALMCFGVVVRLMFPWRFDYTPIVVVVVVLSHISVVGSVVWTAFSLYGLLRFGAPRDLRPDSDWRWDPDALLIVAYVSRGDQPTALRRSMLVTRAVLRDHGVRSVIEAVTDIPVASEHRLDASNVEVIYELVPPEYQTPKGARFKARALQYLLERRTARLAGAEEAENVWILHLDEESTLTPEALFGVRDFIRKYDLRCTPGAIGQGEILYNGGQYGRNPLIETVDSVRTGDDLGRFRTQFALLHRPIFGMHGSFVLVPAKVERLITWDGGGASSITEDAWFALSAMDHGVRFDWVEGFIREQSPFTLFDLIQQRRRWFCGLSAVAKDESLRPSTRRMLRFCVASWALGGAAVIFGLITAIVFGPDAFPRWMLPGMGVCGGAAMAVYVVGAYRNVTEAQLAWPRRLWIIGLTAASVLVLWPPLIEGLGVLYAIWKPMTTFHIVRKEVG
jgi:egghead protein (zeste-white 4 protein)